LVRSEAKGLLLEIFCDRFRFDWTDCLACSSGLVQVLENTLARNLSHSRYIVDNKELFAGKNIVELGAGAGLSGLVAAHYGTKITKVQNI